MEAPRTATVYINGSEILVEEGTLVRVRCPHGIRERTKELVTGQKTRPRGMPRSVEDWTCSECSCQGLALGRVGYEPIPTKKDEASTADSKRDGMLKDLYKRYQLETVEILGVMSSRTDAYEAHWMRAPSAGLVRDTTVSPPFEHGEVAIGTWVKIGRRCRMVNWKDFVVAVRSENPSLGVRAGAGTSGGVTPVAPPSASIAS